MNRGKYLFYSYVLLVFAPVLQYIYVNLVAIASGNIVYWGLARSDLVEAGIMRYVKDFSVLNFIIASNIYMFKLSGRPRRAYAYMTFIILAFGIYGTLGAIGYPNVIIWLSGCRWLMHLYAALLIIPYLMHSPFWRSTFLRRKITKLLWVIVVVNSFVVLYQAAVVSRVRYAGIFSNAAVMSVYITGISLILSLLYARKDGLRLLAQGILLIPIYYSGARIAMIMWVIITIFPILYQGGRYRLLALGIGLPIFGLLLFVSTRIAENAADRGAFIGANIMQNPRVILISQMAHDISGSSKISYIFGKGLGYGTNLAYRQTENDQVRDPWNRLIDNGFATFFLQFGTVGLFFLCIGIATWVKYNLHMDFSESGVGRYVWLPFLCLILWSFTQFPFEQLGFMVGVATSVSWLHVENINRRIT